MALAADRLTQALYASSNLPSKYGNICFRVPTENFSTTGESIKTYIPGAGQCFLTAPAVSTDAYHQLAYSLDVEGKLSNITIAELGLDLMFGLPFSMSGFHHLYSSQKHIEHQCAAAVGHSVHFVAFVFFNASAPNISEEIRRKRSILHDELLFAIAEHENPALPIPDSSLNDLPTYLYFRSWNWMEFFPILAIYLALLGYIYFSLTKIAMVKSKAGLAFGAVFGIGASFLVAVGICTRLDLTFGYFFNVTDVFPYVVVLNGLENIVIMTTAVTNCRREYKCDVPHCIAMGLELEGFRMVKHVLLAGFVSFIGVLTGVPQIRDFFLMALIALFTDLLFQLVFFSAILAMDIKRIELEEQCRGQILLNRRQRSSMVENLNEITLAPSQSLGSSTSLFTWPWHIISTTPTPLTGLTSSLAWFHSRRISSILGVFAILFITTLYLESYRRGFYYQLIVNTLSFNLSLENSRVSNSNFPLMNVTEIGSSELASEWWRKLPRGHLQKLFSSANGISLTHRYLTILAPLDLHAHLPLELADDVASIGGDALKSTITSESITSKATSPPIFNDEPISSQVLVVILVVLSVSVIVNLSLLLYTCLSRRFRRVVPDRTANSTFVRVSSHVGGLYQQKLPSQILRVTQLQVFSNLITTFRCGLFQRAVVHTSDGTLFAIDSDSGEITHCSKRYHKPLPAGPDLVKQSLSNDAFFSCWAMACSGNYVIISGRAGLVEVYKIPMESQPDHNNNDNNNNNNNSIDLLFSYPLKEGIVECIKNLANGLVAIIMRDGLVDLVQFSSEYRQISSVYQLRMRPPVLVSSDGTLIALGSSDGTVRVLHFKQLANNETTIYNCVTFHVPLKETGNIKNTGSCGSSDQITAIAIDSIEPVMVSIGLTSGQLLLYEIDPQTDTLIRADDRINAAAANLVFAAVLPRPPIPSYSSKKSTISTPLVCAVSKLVISPNICVVTDATGK